MCLQQQVKWSLKCFLKWRLEQHRPAGVKKELRKYKHVETYNVDYNSSTPTKLLNVFWKALLFIVKCSKDEIWLKRNRISELNVCSFLSLFVWGFSVFWDRGKEHYRTLQTVTLWQNTSTYWESYKCCEYYHNLIKGYKSFRNNTQRTATMNTNM